jgi:uncharacterized phage protein (TIGR02216 family)
VTLRQAQDYRESFGAAAQRLGALAALRLGWRPDDFWAATPAEIAAVLAPPQPGAGFGRADLDRLMEQHP